MPCSLELMNPFWSYWVAGYATCFAVSILYVWMDFAQDQESVPFSALAQNPYFYLYWSLQLIASVLAFFLLLSYEPIQKWPSPFIALIAVFSSSLVLQNQLIKIGDKPVLDFSGLQKGLRIQVKAAAGRITARLKNARVVQLTEQLTKKFKKNPEKLKEIFSRLMLSVGRTDDQIQDEIATIKKRGERLNMPVEYELARKIVQTDIDYAEHVLWSLEL